jgi:hypothetical protein
MHEYYLLHSTSLEAAKSILHHGCLSTLPPKKFVRGELKLKALYATIVFGSIAQCTGKLDLWLSRVVFEIDRSALRTVPFKVALGFGGVKNDARVVMSNDGNSPSRTPSLRRVERAVLETCRDIKKKRVPFDPYTYSHELAFSKDVSLEFVRRIFVYSEEDAAAVQKLAPADIPILILKLSANGSRLRVPDLLKSLRDATPQRG